MSNPSREAYKRQRDADNRAMVAAKKAAGLSRFAGRATSQADSDWRRQISQMPDDTRSITARTFGDPIPGDPRTPWRPVSLPYVSIQEQEGR